MAAQQIFTTESSSSLHNNTQLQNVEILGDLRNVKRIQKLLEHSSVKFKVVQQERNPSVQSLQWDDESSNTHTERDVDLECLTPSSSSNNIYGGSSDDSSSGLDSDGSQSPTPEVSAPSVSPEVRNRRNMILVQSRIKNLKEKTLITPTRLFIKEATFIKHKTHFFTFFLFDDLLLITKTKPTKPGAPRQVKFCKALDLKFLIVEEIPDSSSRGQNLLKLHYSKSKSKKWKRVFSAPTLEQRDHWFTEVNRLRNQLIYGDNLYTCMKSLTVF